MRKSIFEMVQWYNGTLSPPSLLYTWKVLNVTMSLCHDVTSRSDL